MRQPKLYALVRLPDGRIIKQPVKQSVSTSKLERKIIKDTESGLWLYKKKYEYQDRKNLDQSR